jgi:hypothetical protein
MVKFIDDHVKETHAKGVATPLDQISLPLDQVYKLRSSTLSDVYYYPMEFLLQKGKRVSPPHYDLDECWRSYHHIARMSSKYG